MINKNFFASLPSNVQQAVVEASKEAIDWSDPRAINDEKTAMETLKTKYGNDFRDPKDREAFRTACLPLQQAFVKERPGAQDILDMIYSLRKK